MLICHRSILWVIIHMSTLDTNYGEFHNLLIGNRLHQEASALDVAYQRLPFRSASSSNKTSLSLMLVQPTYGASNNMNLPVNYRKLKPHQKRAVREEYLRLQGGECCFCGASLSVKSPYEEDGTQVHRERYPPGFFDNPVHLHHDHITDLTIGAIHSYCNAVSFDYFEDPIGDLPPLKRQPTSEGKSS